MPAEPTGRPTIRTVRSLYKSGNSTVVSIPPDILKELGFSDQDEVVLEADSESGELRIRLTNEEGSAE